MKAQITESKPSSRPSASAKKNVEAIYPLSPLQQGMLFHSMRDPGSGVYVMQLECTFNGKVNQIAFEQAWQRVINRHESLRAGFFAKGTAEPVQIVSRRVSFSLDVQDWRELPAKTLSFRWHSFVQDDRQRGFNLATAPLMRGSLVRVADDHYRFNWTFHHILMDGWSLPLVLHEVFAFYEAFNTGGELDLQSPRPYRDFIAWLRRQDLTEAKRYWRELLAEFDTPVKLPVDRLAGEAPTGYLTETLQLPACNTSELQALAQNHQLTLNTVFQAAWALFLSKLSGVEDVVFGVTVSGRPTELPGVEDIVGLFINTLPLRVQIDPRARLIDLFNQLQAENVSLRQYEYMPLAELHGFAETPRSESLFDSILVFENYPLDEGLTSQRLVDFNITDIKVHEQTNYPLTVVVVPGDSLQVRIIYDRQRFQVATIARLIGYLRTLLEGMTANPQSRISDLPLLTADERQQLLVKWNETETAYPKDHCIHQLFEAQIERTPEATAVVFKDQSLTYVELNAKANQLAHHLRSLGVGPDTLVGLCVDRSLEMVVGLLGILKAGGAYVPLDPAYPEERLTFMLQDTQAPILVTTNTLVAELPVTSATPLCLDSDWDVIGQHSEKNPVPGTEPQHLAYVNYTSGSTGRPKGVSLSQGALMNLLAWQRDVSTASVGDRTLQFASLSFDVSFQEILATLSTGGTLVLVSEPVRRDFDQLIALVQDEDIQRIFLPFVALNNLAEAVRDGDVLPLNEVITAGEQLKVTDTLTRFFRRLPNCTLYNQYGPTEAHVVSQFVLEGQPESWTNTPPIGRPISNTQLHILDGEFNPVPVEVAGELHIGGVQLALGYLNRPDLTAERFIPNPFSKTLGARLYRTGDLARYLSDGNIEFLGRIDHQVKIRGFRIELGEIEATLAQHPAVRETAVLAREDNPGDKRLVAYVVTASEVESDVSALRDYLKQRLPDYMVPGALVMLETLPLTPNGKVDRKALPAPDSALALTQEYVAPRTPTEEMLAEIWVEVLGAERVGIHDNFFELGGHSLLVTQVVSRIRTAFATELPLRALFEAPTVAELAHALEAARLADEGLQAPPIVPAAREGKLPLSFAQQRLWFLDRLEPDNPFYNMPGAVQLQGALDVAAMELSLNALIARHEALRTTFRTINGEALQDIAPTLELTLSAIDLTELPVAEREAQAHQLATEEAQLPFDLAEGPLVRARLLRLAEDDHLLQVTFHHIVSDGWSLGVFVEELTTLYSAFVSGQPTPLAPLPIQYADFAHWQRQWLQGEVLEQQLSYWREKLKSLPPILELPTDRPRPAIQTFHGAHHSITVSAGLTEALRSLSREAGVTLFMTLLAAFQVLLARYTGQRDFAVGTPIANRNRAETEGLIGFFINTLVLHTDLSDNPSFSDLLARTKETTLGAYAHQDLPLERLVDELQPERDMSHSPLFQVMFALQNTPLRALELPGLQLTPWVPEAEIAKFDLTLDLSEEGEVLNGSLEYNTDLFDAATITRLAGHFLILLEGITQEPQARISQLPLLTTAEQEQLLVEWNATQTDYPKDQSIHQLFEQQVERTPEATAVVFEDQSLTYAELNARANQLAHYLRTLGVGPDTLVGLCVERSLEMVTGLLSILKAGGTYVPLDPAYPQERLAFMLEDTQAPVLVTQSATVERLPANHAQVVCLDRDWSTIAQQSERNPATHSLPEHRAYVIHTSGSTGRPKGIQISHRALVNFLRSMARRPGIDSDEVVLAVTTLSFDISTLEIFVPLIVGARTVIASREEAQDGNRLLELLIDSGTTLLQATPATWQILIKAGWQSTHALKVLCGGEALSGQLAADLQERATVVWNMYGPTETTVWSSVARINAIEGVIPVGPPIANTQLYILDTELNPVPLGVAGELHIGGLGLARGYLNRPDLTGEKFIPDPFSVKPGTRMYKTGDLVRYMPDSNIEFFGRVDHQVKVRGFRIELGEIEATLTQHPQVREVVVSVREDSPGDKRLTAYIVTAPEAEWDVSALRVHLKEKLPEYMVPATFVRLDALPLTPNGKVDRKALPVPDIAMALAQEYMAPRTITEEMLANIWAEVLHLEHVGIHDNFFDLGGHSLLAVQLMAAVEQCSGQVLPLAMLFHTPTIEQLAAKLDQDSGGQAWSPLVPIKPEGSHPPFFCVPGGNGLVLSLQWLAHYVGTDQPFYGLQAVGLDGESAPLDRIEDMADLYIKAIKSVRPQGPYLLGGYSFGGWVAFEMALQLCKQGDQVQQLVIIDTNAPHGALVDLDDLEFFTTVVGELEQLWGVDLQLSCPELAGLGSERQVDYLYQALQDVDVLPANFGKAQLTSLMRVTKTNSRIHYSPAEKYPKGLTLFRASDTRPREARGQNAQETDPTLGWEALCEGPVEVHLVPGDHSTIVREPHVQELAKKLEALLLTASASHVA